MNYKKLLSIVLSMAVIVSQLTIAPLNVAANDIVKSLENLIPTGDMEDDTASFSTAGTKTFEIDQALTDNPNNQVLKIDGSTSTSATKLTIKSLTSMTAGRTYYIDFDYKINLGSHVRIRNAAYGNAIVAGNGNADAWYRLSETYNKETYSNIITPGADTYYQDIIIGTGTVGKELYIDNLVFYDITDAVAFNPLITDNGVEINWKSGVVSINGEDKTIENSLVTFTAKAPSGFVVDTVEVDGETLLAENGIYSFVMPVGAEPEINITTVEDLGIPNIVSVSPVNCINMFTDDATVTVCFDREIDITTMNNASIWVEPTAEFTVEKAAEEYTYNLIFDELSEGTEYTVTFTSGVQTDKPMGLEEEYIYKFSTYSAYNILENGDMNEDTAVYNIDANNFPSYKTLDGNRVLYWKVGWENAPINQYVNGENRAEKYLIVPGHKYYTETQIMAEKDIEVAWRIAVYNPETKKTSVYPKTASWKSINANEWTDISYLFDALPSDAFSDNAQYAIRLVARAVDKTYPANTYIDNWGLYDYSTAPEGAPVLISSSPENGASNIEPGTLDVKLEFDRPVRPSSVRNIAVTNAEVKNIESLDGNKAYIVTLDKIKVNTTIKMALNNLLSLKGEKIAEEEISFDAKYVNPKIPDITVALGGKPVSTEGITKVYVNGLTMEIKSDVPFDEETVVQASVTSDTENLIEKVEWSADKPDTINVVFNQEVLTPGESYNVTLLPAIKSQAGTSIAEKTIAFQTLTTKETVDLYKDIVKANDSAKLVEFLKTSYKDLNDSDTLSAEVIHTDNALLEKIVAKLISEKDSVATAEEISDKVWETTIFTIVNETNDENLISATVESILNQSDKTGLAYTYTNYLTQAMKDALPQKISNYPKDFGSADEYIHFVEEDIILNSFKNSNGWETVSNIFVKNKDFFDTATQALIDKVNNSSNKEKIYGSLQGMDVSTKSEAYAKLDDAYENNNSTPGGGGSGGGSGSGGSGGGSGSGGSGGGSGSVGLLPVAPIVGSNDNNVSEDKTAFKDIVSVPWAKDAIEYLYDIAVINGKSKDMFCPEDLVKREEFVKMIVIAANIPSTDKSVKYTDVSENDWFYPYVAAASNYGLVKGLDKNTYGTGQNITRQDIAVLCSRLLTNADEPLKDEIVDFADKNEVSDYAVKAVDKVAYLGLIVGNENLEFSPKKYATRAETAVILQRLIALLNQYSEK